jgi:hypothetical protein
LLLEKKRFMRVKHDVDNRKALGVNDFAIGVGSTRNSLGREENRLGFGSNPS